jgi:succinoglycan biosynthesis transport protein ExoP
VTLLEFLRLTRAHALFLLGMLTLGVVAAFLVTLQQPVLYSATSTGLVKLAPGSSAGEEMGNLSLAREKASSYQALVTTVPVAERVVDNLGLDVPPEAIVGRFSASVDSSSGQILRISASAPTPEEARDLANSVVRATAAEAQELEAIGTPEGAPRSDLVQVVPLEQAGLPRTPYSPNYVVNLLVGAAAGLVVGYLLVLARRSVDRRVRSVSDVEEVIEAPVLGLIPKTDRLGQGHRGVQSDLGPSAEAFRQLRTNLRYANVDDPPRRIVVTSALQGEGKSTVSANVARLVAHAGTSVVLIDADLRRPTLSTTFGTEDDIGLTQVLAGDVPVREALVDSGFDNLVLLPAGRVPPNPSELLGSHRMRQVVDDLARDHLVLLDAPPLLPVTDAGLLTGFCDGALLVIASGKTSLEQAEQCRRILEQVSGRLLGAVLNKVPQRGGGAARYGYGGYSYGSYKLEEASRKMYAEPEAAGSGRRRKSA